MVHSTKRVVVAGAILALGAAACGGGGSASGSGSTKALHAVQTAYKTALQAKTAKVSFTESVHAKSASGSTETATVTGNGVVDFSNHSFELQVNAPSGGSIELRETAGVEYIEVPPASRTRVPGHKPWVSVNLNKVSQAKLGKSFSQLESARSDNPTDALGKLQSVSDNVTKVGTASVGGAQTTEYSAQVDLDKVAAKEKAKVGPKAAQAVKHEEQVLGTHTLPLQVWVGPKGMVRQLHFQVPIPSASTGATNGSGKATMTMTFSAFGSPVQVAPPPASQTADITARVLQQSGSGSQ